MKYIIFLFLIIITSSYASAEFGYGGEDNNNLGISIYQGNLTNLSQMQDVNTAGATTGQALIYNSTTGKWFAFTIEGISDTNETLRFNNLVDIDCGTGYLVKGIQTNGTVLCEEDTIGSITDTNASTECADGEFLNGDGTCDAGYLDTDGIDSDTIYTNGTGISLVGNVFSLIGSFFSGSWNDLTDVPSGFSDGIDNDTTYSHLSNFTDDLGDRGYTSLSNFTNDYGYYNSTTLPDLNSTGLIINWSTEYPTETDPYWTANYTLYNTTWSADTDTNETLRVNNIVNNDCSIGNFVNGFETNGTPICDAPSGSGDITDINTNGPYLTGGADSGDVSLLLNETYLNQTIDSEISVTVDQTFLQTILDSVYNPLWNYDYNDLINTPTIPVLWDATFNSTGDSRWVQLSNIVSLIGNWSEDKSSYSTTSQANDLYAPINYGDDWNKTYADTLYYGIDNPYSYYNSTDFDINDYYLKPTAFLTVLGNLAGNNNTQSDSSLFGYGAGQNNIGTTTTAIGYYAGYDNTGNNLVAVGYGAGQYNNVDRVTAVGYNSGQSNTGQRTTFIGYNSGKDNDGGYGTGIGAFANNENTGQNITSIGYSAGYQNTGDNSVFIGTQSGVGNSENNVFILKHNIVNTDALITGNFQTGNIVVNENITATEFLGSGAYLTGINQDNSSWNQTYADTLYSNDTWVDTFFVRFTELVGQVGNFSAWDYDYGDLINKPIFTNDTWVDTYFPRFTEIVGLVGNWTLDKASYSTTAEADLLYAPINYGDDWNKTYADTLYYGIDNPYSYYNSTDFDINNYIPYTGATSNVELGNNNFSVGTSDLFVNSNINRVGIGTLTPTAKLDVNGSANIGSELNVSGNTTIGEDLNISGDVYLPTNSRIYFGDGQEASIYYNGTKLILSG